MKIISSLLLFLPFVSSSQKLNLVFDFSNAKATNSILKQGADPGLINKLIALPVTNDLVKKIQSYDQRATADSYISGLKTMVSGKELTEDPFQWKKVFVQRNQIDSLIEFLEKNESSVKQQIVQALLPYTPSSAKTDVQIHFILGGSSDGFAPNNQHFYIALHYFDTDVQGMIKMMTHELYHCIQAEFQNDQARSGLSKTASNLYDLVRMTYKEGSAVFVGGSFLGQSTGKYSEWYGEKFKRNIEAINDNMALFDLIAFRLINDSTEKFSTYQKFGFSGKWDSRFYFLGFLMAQAIDKYKGKEILIQSLTNPVLFFKTYIDLYNQHPDIGPRFSQPVERAIGELYLQTN
jgi:hypothetical protein